MSSWFRVVLGNIQRQDSVALVGIGHPHASDVTRWKLKSFQHQVRVANARSPRSTIGETMGTNKLERPEGTRMPGKGRRIPSCLKVRPTIPGCLEGE